MKKLWGSGYISYKKKLHIQTWLTVRLYLSVIYILARTIYSFLFGGGGGLFLSLPPPLSLTHTLQFGWWVTHCIVTHSSHHHLSLLNPNETFPVHSFCLQDRRDKAKRRNMILALWEKLKLPWYFPAAEYVCLAPKMLNELEITKESKDWGLQVNILTFAVFSQICFIGVILFRNLYFC